ncbi:dipeptidase [Sedimentibacter sp.]|uniref:dipeptidase n=1 Tax=Sedimentibacter sp. TaxID=1960295 RepID=UPI0028A7B722|nr:dipeptidase [Sedimentibacter sp.]
MKRGMEKILVFLLVLLFVIGSSTIAVAVPAISENALKIHDDAITIDTHNDTMLRVIDSNTWLPVNNIGNLLSNAQLDIPKMEAGGLDVAFFGSYTSGYTQIGRAGSRLLSLINALHWTERMNSEKFGLAFSVNEIEELAREGKSVGVPTIEGAYSLEEYNAIELLNQYYDLGIRVVGLCWSNSNSLGEGVNEKYVDGTPSEGGLTNLGVEVVKEMNRLGMIVDVSHMNEETFWDVIEVAEAPIMASHSNVMGLFEHARNLTDEQIIAIANTNGIVQQNFYAGYLGPVGDRDLKKLVDHIEYVIDLVGIDYVGLGSDFDGGGMPVDLPNASFYYRITEELVERGYKKSEIEKILGKNTLRVMKEVQNSAEKDPENAGQGITIVPDIQMGEGVSSYTPLLKAEVLKDKGSHIDESKFRVIVDGIVYSPEYDEETGELSLQIDEPLIEKFHVVTFEGENNSGKVTRETRIFYIEN